MNENKTKVIDWIRSGMNYNEGVSLLADLTKRPAYAHQFFGREKGMADKVAYEICKAAGVADFKTWKDFIEQTKTGASDKQTIAPIPRDKTGKFVKRAPVKQPPPEIINTSAHQHISTSAHQHISTSAHQHISTSAHQEPESIETRPLSEYPPVIRRLVHEYALLFQERSMLHTAMAGIPESNAEAVCKKRAEMFDMIKSISVRLEELYNAKKDYDDKGIIPDEKELFSSDAPGDLKSLDIDKGIVIPVDPVELKKRKKNLQSSNSKDVSMLDYQSKKVAKVKNPMPKGPKRSKIEARIKERIAKIDEIDELLVKNAVKE